MKKFYICEKCGNLVELVEESGAPLVCCGQKMTELVPGTVEASREKHIPVAEVEGNLVKVNVGSVNHPMAEEHSILWIQLETDKGSQRKYLAPGEAPHAEFALNGEKPVAVLAYCNLHGLWKADV
jgi:superoxide reductase